MRIRLLSLAAVLALGWGAVWAAERQVMRSRVPPDQLEAARALSSPLQPSPESIEKGKALYEGKGTCINCHGPRGAGDGPMAATLDPPPRNFRLHRFWRHRTEGEIFWVIKYGSPGTAMVGFGKSLDDDEIWAVIEYLRDLAGGAAGEHGRGPRGGRRGGPHGPGMGGPKTPGMEPDEAGCCGSERNLER